MAEGFGRTRRATILHEAQETTMTLTSMPETQQGEEIFLIDATNDGYMADVQVDKEVETASPTKHIPTTNPSFIDNEMLYLLATGLTEFWQRKLFHDVTIYCAKDGGTIKCHRLVLAGLSPIFQLVLKMAEDDAGTINGDDEVIILPDVSSKVLLLFLDSVYKGKPEEATVDEELGYLQFSHEFKSGNTLDKTVVESKFSIDVDKEKDTSWEGIEKTRFRSKRSFVWGYFSPVGKQNAQCNICKKVQKVEKSSTTYLIRHLKNHHTKHYFECRKRQEKEEDKKEGDDGLSHEGDMDSFLTTPQDGEGVIEDADFGSFLTKEPKSGKPSPSKFRFLTGQISKLAKNKSALNTSGQTEGGERRKRSLCWKYFTRLEPSTYDCVPKDDGEKVCKCNICGQSFPLSSSKSTILMLRHLRRHHREVFDSSPNKGKPKGKNKSVKNEEHFKSIQDKGTTLNTPHDNLGTTTQGLDKQDIIAQKESVDAKKENLEPTKKSVKRKHNATLKEQKELREKGLVMFLKPTKPRVKTPSVAWIFFDVINKDTARCIICENVVPTPLWNTNGLLRHLKKDHLDECEQWEAENVHNFDPTHISPGQIHPIWQYFKQMDDLLKEGDEAGSYACNYCDIVHVGIMVPQQIYILEAHLKQFHPEDSCKEYEMEKVAILCRKRKEQMKVVAEEPANINVSQASSQEHQINPESLDTGENSALPGGEFAGKGFAAIGLAGKIVLQPHEIIQDIKKGLLNILAADFFSQFSRDTMQCKLCSASCKVLTNGPNRSNNLWKHLSVSHVDVHAQLEAEREVIAQSLPLLN